MSSETELKLLLSPGDHKALLEADCLAGLKVLTRKLKNTYYDTPALDLHHERVALRIREHGGRYIQTLKTQGESFGGLSRRSEWEWELDEDRLNGEVLAEVWPEALKTISVSTLEPAFSTDFKRQIIHLEWQSATIELALDKGTVKAGDQTSPISELELELKSGDEAALQHLARKLAHKVNLVPSDISKAQRGYRLVTASRMAE